jgi:hypothetical protein
MSIPMMSTTTASIDGLPGCISGVDSGETEPRGVECSGITESQRRGHPVLAENMEREGWIWRGQPWTGVGEEAGHGGFCLPPCDLIVGEAREGKWD